MYKIISVFFVATLLVACSKQNNSNSAQQTFYFKCQVDSNNIDVSYSPTLTSSLGQFTNGIVTTSTVSSQIYWEIGSGNCTTIGSYCFYNQVQIAGQTAGTYTPLTFLLQIPKGGDTYNYTHFPSLGGNIKVTITDIQHSPTPTMVGSNNYQWGYIKGTFTGTATKQKYSATGSFATYSPVAISGSFSIPLN
ncbi:MAG: hypothetical protein JSR12_06565 [Bacteroidetes bacterium]|nr:hypothetical protein [Bacteroidota bacterium]